ncbi:hypothetical protein [Pseudomonas indica]|uniref:hypothetical protein n=1 Tax=Pseudomonas indica TaxID=137658 RepID=UPI0023F91194|nr:hypothetical protein [Pseudomonas indica]MBU3054764.1 hypothetical protein [Pseudomonas indica]
MISRTGRKIGTALLLIGLSAQVVAGPGPGGHGGPGPDWGPGPGWHRDGHGGHGLPDFAREVWIGSMLYFVAAGTYYLWNANTQRYEVVVPPPAVQGNSVASYEVIAYPAQGQSLDQQGRDRYECHTWAVGQSGFDPATATRPVGAESTERYRRALGACLTGRGYSVN